MLGMLSLLLLQGLWIIDQLHAAANCIAAVSIREHHQQGKQRGLHVLSGIAPCHISRADPLTSRAKTLNLS